MQPPCPALQVLVKVMSITLGATAAYFSLTGLYGYNSLAAVWWGLVLFFVTRLSQSLRAMLQLYE